MIGRIFCKEILKKVTICFSKICCTKSAQQLATHHLFARKLFTHCLGVIKQSKKQQVHRYNI